MESVRVAIIGVGTARHLSSIVHYYATPPTDFIPGSSPRSRYHVGDIEFSSAFDIAERKLARPRLKPRAASDTRRFAEVPHLGVPVRAHDPRRLGTYLSH